MESQKVIIKVPFIFDSDEKEYKNIFFKEFLNQEISYHQIPVIFVEDDFHHICYEKGKEGIDKQQFGVRRARRLLVLKNILLGSIPSELRYEPETGNYCLLCEDLDFVVFLVPNPKGKNLLIGTIIHFGEGFTKAIQKQKNKTVVINKIEFNGI